MVWTEIMHFLNSVHELEHLNVVQLPDTPQYLTNRGMKKERLIFFYEKGKGPKQIINFFFSMTLFVRTIFFVCQE